MTGNSVKATPPPVATPLPPWNRRVTGKMWPSTAAVPAAMPSQVPPTAKPSSVAMTPLEKSRRRTSAPGHVPEVRRTLVAPGLCEPSTVGS